jgi:hypothetical protein
MHEYGLRSKPNEQRIQWLNLQYISDARARPLGTSVLGVSVGLACGAGRPDIRRCSKDRRKWGQTPRHRACDKLAQAEDAELVALRLPRRSAAPARRKLRTAGPGAKAAGGAVPVTRRISTIPNSIVSALGGHCISWEWRQ